MKKRFVNYEYFRSLGYTRSQVDRAFDVTKDSDPDILLNFLLDAEENKGGFLSLDKQLQPSSDLQEIDFCAELAQTKNAFFGFWKNNLFNLLEQILDEPQEHKALMKEWEKNESIKDKFQSMLCNMLRELFLQFSPRQELSQTVNPESFFTLLHHLADRKILSQEQAEDLVNFSTELFFVDSEDAEKPQESSLMQMDIEKPSEEAKIGELQKQEASSMLQETDLLGESKQQIEEVNLTDKEVCVICMSGARAYLYLPCKHLLTCENCKSKCQICPVCQTAIKEAIKIYWS